MTNDEVFKVFSKVVRDATQVHTVVRANTPDEAPKGEYCSILISSQVEPKAKGEKKRTTSKDGQTITTTIRIPIIYRITLNFYRGNAIANATKMIHCSRLPTINARLFKADLGWVGSESVMNLTDLQSGRMEERASIVVNLIGTLVQEETVNTILSVGLTVEDEKRNQLLKIETAKP